MTVAVGVDVSLGVGVKVLVGDGVTVGVKEGVTVGVLLGVDVGVKVTTGNASGELSRSSRSRRIHPPSYSLKESI